MVAALKIIAVLLIITISLFNHSLSCSFTLTNNCPHTIWPGTLAGAGTPDLPTTGFQLDPGKSVRIPTVPGWSGRIWARTGCTFDKSGAGTCQTGDCGGRLECNGIGATPPASLFEITLGKGNDKDFYDVSIVDGYNLPLVAAPHGVFGGCNVTGCISDLNLGCPKELQVVEGVEAGGVIACKSACEAFGMDQYCCSGEFANPTSCRPSYYSTIFKKACPRAYSYAFDDGTSTFTCKAYEYAIIFCPTPNGVRSDGVSPPPPTHEDSNGEFVSPPPPIHEDNNGEVVSSPPPPPIHEDNNGEVVSSPPPPIHEDRNGEFVSPPPPIHEDSNGEVVSPPPPPNHEDSNGAVVSPPPPPNHEDSNGQFVSPPPPIYEDSNGEAMGIVSSSNTLYVPMLILLILNFF